MTAVKTTIAEIKVRGQLTIPKKIREQTGLDAGDMVNIIPVGDSLIITPHRLEIEEARRQIRKILKAAGVSPEEILADLKEEREALFEEAYGKKS
ncbi:MAG TPA: AbrB/MazE/SpoVT family DNA-binding domain-containing protein [Nitrospirae bacterium]|nr:AbrB/MazE/SpoVT family DNA-binding domain-containing protein [Nitrospirota bacterium]